MMRLCLSIMFVALLVSQTIAIEETDENSLQEKNAGISMREKRQTPPSLTQINDLSQMIKAQQDNFFDYLHDNCEDNQTDPTLPLKECPLDWKFFRGSCYLFSNDTRTWDASKTFCESLNASLVIVEDAAEDSYIRSVISAGQFHDFYWIGGRFDHTQNEFRWIDQTAITFNGWGPSQPQFLQGCMAYLNGAGVTWQWANIPLCTRIPAAYICEIN